MQGDTGANRIGRLGEQAIHLMIKLRFRLGQLHRHKVYFALISILKCFGLPAIINRLHTGAGILINGSTVCVIHEFGSKKLSFLWHNNSEYYERFSLCK